MKNKTLQAFLKYKVVVLIFLIFGFLTGYFVTEYIVNNNLSYYKIDLYSNQNPSTFLNSEYFENTLKEIDEYNQTAEKKISYANIDYESMLKSIKIENINNEGSYSVLVKRKFFPSTVKVSNGLINEGTNRCSTYFKLILEFDKTNPYNIKFFNEPICELIGEYNPYLLGLGTMLGMLLISFSFFFIVTHGKSKGLLIDISDGELVFKTPFNKRYWSLANKEMSNVKNLCSIALLFAIMFLCKAITIPSGFGALGLGLTYLVFSVIAMIYGPICGMTIGILSDVLGHFIYPSGAPFFIGYTINSLLSGLIYGLCFYRTKVTFAKCLYARVFVNLFVNIFLGSIWWAIVYNLNFDGFVAYVMLISIPKNLVYLLPQAILLFLFLKICAKPIGAFGVIDERIAENVSII